MDNLSKKINKAVNKEITRRSMINYFATKGYEDFSSLISPPGVYDMMDKVPELYSKLEIVPFVESHDPRTNVTKIGWNLFVLGINRMYLGETTHTSLGDLKSAMNGASINEALTRTEQTPETIINFILRILEQTEHGFDLLPDGVISQSNNPIAPTNRPKIGPTMSGGYFEKNKIA